MQAAIAALHDEADRPEDTDWPQILALYDLLEELSGNPMVTLNRAIAAAMVDGPEVGLELLRAARRRSWTGTTGWTRSVGICTRCAVTTRPPSKHFRAAARGTTSLPERDYLTTEGGRRSVVLSEAPHDLVLSLTRCQ